MMTTQPPMTTAECDLLALAKTFSQEDWLLFDLLKQANANLKTMSHVQINTAIAHLLLEIAIANPYERMAGVLRSFSQTYPNPPFCLSGSHSSQPMLAICSPTSAPTLAALLKLQSVIERNTKHSFQSPPHLHEVPVPIAPHQQVPDAPVVQPIEDTPHSCPQCGQPTH